MKCSAIFALLAALVTLVPEVSSADETSPVLVDGNVIAVGGVCLCYDSKHIFVTTDQTIRVSGNASVVVCGSPTLNVFGDAGPNNIKVGCYFGSPTLDVTTDAGKDTILLSTLFCGGFAHLDVDDDVSNQGGQLVTVLLYRSWMSGEIYVTKQDPQAVIKPHNADFTFNRYDP